MLYGCDYLNMIEQYFLNQVLETLCTLYLYMKPQIFPVCQCTEYILLRMSFLQPELLHALLQKIEKHFKRGVKKQQLQQLYFEKL